MAQLSLGITPRLTYSPKNFLFHEGVREEVEHCMTVLSLNSFRICYFQAPRRAGKTHLAIKLYEVLSGKGRTPFLLHGKNFSAWLKEQKISELSEPTVLLDDADVYLRSLPPGKSGEFVSFIEEMRTHRGVFLSFNSTPIDELPCDNHVKSRLFPGAGFTIRPPGEADMQTLLKTLAKQRGMYLNERKLQYLSSRLRRDISSLEDYLERVWFLSTLLNSGIKFPILSNVLGNRL